MDIIVDFFINDKKVVCDYKPQKSNDLIIHLLDVGQSESILVTQGKKTMLIDTSLPEYGKGICNYLKKMGVQKINILLLTHPHIDHVGGASKILRTFDVDTVYFSDTSSIVSIQNLLYLNAKRVCFFKGIPTKLSKTGSNFSFGKSNIQFIAPLSDTYNNINNYSIGIRITYGYNSILLLGDAQAEEEAELVNSTTDLKCDILKISHHGSITSSIPEFLDATSPKYAILSVGSYNTYGHPTETVMNRFKSRSIPIYRTDELGTIILTTDGKKIHFNTKSGSYKSRKKEK